MAYWFALLVVSFSWLSSISFGQQILSSQVQILRQLDEHLEYPKALETWKYAGDLCNTPGTVGMSIRCREGSVTELRITGDKHGKVNEFNNSPIPGQTLSNNFSIDSLVVTLSRLTRLRIVILVSLGIWGHLPDTVNHLRSLEVLDLSRNFIFGSIPSTISTMVNLQTLKLDDNYFSGGIPDFFDSLNNLHILSLKENRLKGQIPLSICKNKELTELSLSHNHISGRIPDLSQLRKLQLLDLRENSLDSELPLMPKCLITILLSKNSLTGEISKELSTLHKLQHLDLSFNFLSGWSPPALFSLPNLSYLNLASNMLGGSLPQGLVCSNDLGFVDISTNRLTGPLPSCLNSMSNGRMVIYEGNCLSVNDTHQHEESYCKEFILKKKGYGAKEIGVLTGVIGGIVLFLLFCTFLILCRKYYPTGIGAKRLPIKSASFRSLQCSSLRGFSCELIPDAKYISQFAKLETHGFPRYRIFLIDELKEATNNFDLSLCIGEGSLGKMYKGKMENGNLVAIRCLPLFNRYSIQNLRLRLDLLSKLRHSNLVCLLGHCIDYIQDDGSVDYVFLVYEFLPNMNLHTRLCAVTNSLKVLEWSERLSILISIAKAVHFLHAGVIPGFYNNRLKTNNVFLNENGLVKLSDYGLSVITEDDENIEELEYSQTSSSIGTKSHSWKITNVEDDIYSFGFILLETLVGSTISEKGEAFLHNEMYTSFSKDQVHKCIVVDPIVLTTSSQESLSIVMSLMNRCILPETPRPSIEDILWNLQYAAQVQGITDGEQKPERGSPP